MLSRNTGASSSGSSRAVISRYQSVAQQLATSAISNLCPSQQPSSPLHAKHAQTLPDTSDLSTISLVR